MKKQIIRITETDLRHMVEESVKKILSEGEGFNAFMSGLNLKGIGKFAVDQLYEPKPEAKIGDDTEKRQKDFERTKKFLNKNPNATFQEFNRDSE